MTFILHKSDLFKRQWLHYAQDYKDKAGLETASRFITAVEEALRFIRHNAHSCPIYDTTRFPALQQYIYRKWTLHRFPYAVFFRVMDKTVYLDMLYCLRMDIRPLAKVVMMQAKRALYENRSAVY